MPEVPSGRIVGYDAASGVQLFVEVNRATQHPDGTSAMPQQGDSYQTGGRNYRVIGIRKDSTETLCNMDVTEEPEAK